MGSRGKGISTEKVSGIKSFSGEVTTYFIVQVSMNGHLWLSLPSKQNKTVTLQQCSAILIIIININYNSSSSNNMCLKHSTWSQCSHIAVKNPMETT